MRAQPEGLIVPLVTPVAGGRVDLESLARLAGILSRLGLQLFPVSTTGEAPVLSREDKLAIVETVAGASKTPVWAGTSLNSAEETVTLGREMLDRGASGLVVVTPYYYRVSQEALYRYYSHILQRVDAPIIAYTIPGAACNKLAPETVERLAEEHSNLTAIKVTSEDAGYLARIIAAVRGTGLRVMPGSVVTLPVARAYGVRSAILAVGNLLPKTARTAVESDDEWHNSYRLLARTHYILNNGAGPCTIKTILQTLGIIRENECLGPLRHEQPRPPPAWLIEEARKELQP